MSGEAERRLVLFEVGGSAYALPISDVIEVAVCDQNRVDPIRFELVGGAGRIARQERVDIDAVPGGKVEAERCVSEPGERASHDVQGTSGAALWVRWRCCAVRFSYPRSSRSGGCQKGSDATALVAMSIRGWTKKNVPTVTTTAVR